MLLYEYLKKKKKNILLPIRIDVDIVHNNLYLINKIMNLFQ